MIILFIASLVLWVMAMTTFSDYDTIYNISRAICLVIAIGILVFGVCHGFINYPKTEGIHQGVITAVDLEGVYFRRYEVYLKSSGYTNQSDETVYGIYDYETELAEQLKNAIGKTVKIYYGHDGGYIPWNSCGTYHIKSIEIIEEGK